MIPTPLRGRVYRIDIGYGARPWLIVSNNRRNAQLDSVLGARLTTTNKSFVPTAVPLTAADHPLVGYVLADEIERLDADEIATATCLGAICPATLLRVNDALSIALGLP